MAAALLFRGFSARAVVHIDLDRLLHGAVGVNGLASFGREGGLGQQLEGVARALMEVGRDPGGLEGAGDFFHLADPARRVRR